MTVRHVAALRQVFDAIPRPPCTCLVPVKCPRRIPCLKLAPVGRPCYPGGMTTHTTTEGNVIVSVTPDEPFEGRTTFEAWVEYDPKTSLVSYVERRDFDGVMYGRIGSEFMGQNRVKVLDGRDPFTWRQEQYARAYALIHEHEYHLSRTDYVCELGRIVVPSDEMTW